MKTVGLTPVEFARVGDGDRPWNGKPHPPASGLGVPPLPGEQGDSPSPSEPPSTRGAYSLLNLLSWYRVTVPLLDGTQILRALRNSASVLLPVTSAAF